MRILILAADESALEEAGALVRAGHEVDLITSQGAGEPVDEVLDGVRVARVAEYPPMVSREDRLAWALQLSAGLLERTTRLSPGEFDLIHAYGWQVAWAAAAAKNLLSVPLVSTLVDCEQTRSPGELSEESKLILQAEWWLTYESRATIVPSVAVCDEIERLFELPARKQAVIADAADAAATVEVYERVLAEEADLRRHGDDRPPLRVILGRAQMGST